jgi:hypothetical protein
MTPQFSEKVSDHIFVMEPQKDSLWTSNWKRFLQLLISFFIKNLPTEFKNKNFEQLLGQFCTIWTFFSVEIETFIPLSSFWINNKI